MRKNPPIFINKFKADYNKQPGVGAGNLLFKSHPIPHQPPPNFTNKCPMHGFFHFGFSLDDVEPENRTSRPVCTIPAIVISHAFFEITFAHFPLPI